MSIISILIFIIILLILVMVHELGHFIVAKLTGCRVDEFAFGFPPTIWKKKIGETEYKFNAIPIGGYVKIWGEDGSNHHDKRMFTNRPKWAQISVLIAGVMMNWLLAFFIFFILAKSSMLASASDPQYASQITNPKLIIESVNKNGPAYHAGIREGYEITQIVANGKTANLKDSNTVRDFLVANIDADIKIKWTNGNDKGDSVVTGVYGINKDKKAIGIAFDVLGNLKLDFVDSFKYALKRVYVYTVETFGGLAELGRGIMTANRDTLNGVSGPVGIAKIVGQQAAHGSLADVALLAAILSINLAVFNLLPFPALDGGRIIMVIYEAIMKKKIKHSVASAINGVGFMALILLLVVVTINDIFK